MMRRFVLLLAFCLVPFASAAERVTLDAASRARAGIVLRPVLERSFGARVSVVGEVVRSPGTTISVRTPYDARVEELLVSPGDRVGRGAPLLRVHSHEIQHKSAEYLQHVEALRMAESRVEAGKELLALEGISRLEFEQRKQKAYNARLLVESEYHHLLDMGLTEAEFETMAERGIPNGFATLVAPKSGVVLSLNARQHQWYEAFDPLVELGDPGRLELQVQIAPSDAGRVEKGDTVEFAPVGYPERAGRARVISAIPAVDPVTRTVTVRARIEDRPGDDLVPGVYVQGQLVHGDERRSPSVPEGAVIRIGGRDYVFVSVDAATFEARAVRLGVFNGARYEVLDGLDAGENVAAEGVFLLKSTLLAQGAEAEGSE
jgi:RND family efflux transporter MFP subunit